MCIRDRDHPVNIAYEAATADLDDVNMIDPFHLEAYGIKTVNYNRDVEIFPVLNRLFAVSYTHLDVYKRQKFDLEGSGLFRTEFLFLERSEAPTLEEQTDTYTKVLRSFGSRRVVVRTLDAGADKPLSFADLGAEEKMCIRDRFACACREGREPASSGGSRVSRSRLRRSSLSFPRGNRGC